MQLSLNHSQGLFVKQFCSKSPLIFIEDNAILLVSATKMNTVRLLVSMNWFPI